MFAALKRFAWAKLADFAVSSMPRVAPDDPGLPLLTQSDPSLIPQMSAQLSVATAEKKVTMSAMPAAQRDVSGEPGYLMLLRGQPFTGYSPAKHGPLFNYRLLPGRAGDAGAHLFHQIYDRTWSALGCPEWARIPLSEFCEYAPHKSERAIRLTLKFLVDIHLIERDPKDPWRLKTHPENVACAPLLMPVRHPNASVKKR